MSDHQPTSQIQPPTGDYRDAKAQAKAAKAYAKAQRPWYKKKRFLFPLALVAIIVIATATSSGGGTSTGPTSSANPATTPQDQASAPQSAAPAADAPTDKFPMQNGDWRLDSLRVKDDGLGDFGGAARITYTGSDQNGGNNMFTVTVFKDGKDIAVLNGSANSVMPGKTVTVELISQDKFVSGSYKYAFQNDL